MTRESCTHVHRLRFLAPALAFAGLALSSLAARAADPLLAIRAEGYLGYSRIEAFDEFDGFQGGGTGSLSLVLDEFYVQGDVFGDRADYEGDLQVETVGPGLHLGWRDAQRGSAGVVATYDHLEGQAGSVEAYRTGFEGELYLDRLTLGLNGGYLGVEDSGSGYLDALVAFYPIERLRLNVRGGALGIESSPVVAFGLGGDYLVADFLAPFVRWESLVANSFGGVLQQSVVAGLSVYWGGSSPSLRNYDRTHFKSSCAGVMLVGRIC